jgi:CRISPR-associated protein Cst2
MSEITHVAGTFLIRAHGSFLNGAGLGEGEDRNVTVPKTLLDGNRRVPYVSAQAWKRWLRTTLIDETGWPASELHVIGEKDKKGKKTTNKIAGMLDPITYAEDDLFGYMRAQPGQGKRKTDAEPDDEDQDDTTEKEASEGGASNVKVKSLMRASPFSASLLISTRRNGWKARDEGFVHLKEGTPLPYTTEFYTTNLQGIFCLAHARVGVFANEGDRVELDELTAQRYEKEGKLTRKGGSFELTNARTIRKERSGELLKALSVLRGGAKQAAFGTDIAPKCLILAGLSCGNAIFNDLFEDDEDGSRARLNVQALKEVLGDYCDRVKTPVCIGIRTGYLANEDDIRKLAGELPTSRGVVQVRVSTPREAAELIAAAL